ncbi:MAG: hypothetical protein WC975_14465 [Phycisphaerae bacterium]
MKRKSLLLMLVVITLGGCRLGMLLQPDPRPLVEAKYKIAKGKKLAVLIDDYMSPVNNPELKSVLAKKIADGLVEGGAVRAGSVVSIESVNQIPKDSPDGKKISIQHIGSQVQADYVLYVNIIDFKIQGDPENPLIQPTARAYIKVIDVSTGERLWPIDVTGEPVEAQGRMDTETLSDNPDTSKWTDTLTDLLSVEVVQLFFDHRSGK